MSSARWPLAVIIFAGACVVASLEGTLGPIALVALVSTGTLVGRFLPRLIPAWSTGAGLLIYAATVSIPFAPARLLLALLAVTALVSADPKRRALAGTGAALGVPLVLLVAVLDDRTVALQLITALVLGCGAALLGLSRGFLPPARLAPPSIEHDSQRTRFHGVALCLAAAALPIGEGAGYVGLGLVALLMMVRYREIPWRDGSALYAPAALLGLSLAGGAAAWWLGGHGWLAPREFGRVSAWLAVPLIFYSVRALPAVWAHRAGASFVLVLGVSATLALAQYFLNPESMLDSLQWLSSERQTWVPGQPGHLVAGGFFLNRLKLAHVLLIGLGLVGAHQFVGAPTGRERWVGAAIGTLFVAALFFTFARGALLGAMAGAAAFLTFLSRAWRQRLVAVGVAGLVVVGAVPMLRDRAMSSLSAQAASSRTIMWVQGIELISENPHGVGLGNYPTLAQASDETRTTSEYRPPHHYAHHVMLTAWAENGPLGLVAYAALWWFLFAVCHGHRLGSPRRRVAAAAGAFVVAALWTVGMTHDVLYHKPVALAFCCLIGGVFAIIKSTE